MAKKSCELCQVEDIKYICPTCGVSYCSVGCFKSPLHLECSETFYKKCIQEEVKSQVVDTGSINEILLRCCGNENDSPRDSDDDSDDSDQSENLAKRLENVDLNNDDELWEKLNTKEKHEFINLIKNGELRKLIPEWEPWWKYYKVKKLISVVGEENIQEEHVIPCVFKDIPAFSQITTKTPAENVVFSVANILMSYVYTSRWCKGKHHDMPVDAVTIMFALSSTIRCNKIFMNSLEALISFEDDIRHCEWLEENEITSELIWEDVIDIVGGSKDDVNFCVKACLSDMNDILREALMELKNESAQTMRFTGPPPARKEIKLLSKRILYYLSWTVTYGDQMKRVLM